MGVGHEPVAAARAHVAAGQLAAAQQLLAAAVMSVPADPASADSHDGELVVLYTGVLLALGEPYAARGWAAYGHRALAAVHGHGDRRTLHALGLLAAVLARVGAHTRAAGRYRELVEAYTALDGASSDRALAAQADLATVEHAQGHCVAARLRLATTIDEHRRRHGPAHTVGLRMQLRLAGMWRDCGGFNDAHELLADASDDAAALPADHPVRQALAAAAHTVADPLHRCGGDPAPHPATATTPTRVRRPAPRPASSDAGVAYDLGRGRMPPGPGTSGVMTGAIAGADQAALWDYLTPVYEMPAELGGTAFTARGSPPEPRRWPGLEVALAAAQRPWTSLTQRRLTQQQLVLTAACVGIGALAVLFVLLVTQVQL